MSADDLRDGEAEWLDTPADNRSVEEQEYKKLAALSERQLLELRTALGIGSDYTHGEALEIARKQHSVIKSL